MPESGLRSKTSASAAEFGGSRLWGHSSSPPESVNDMSLDRNLRLRVKAAWLDRLDTLARVLGLDDSRGARSSVLRFVGDQEIAEWLDSPYYCQEAKYFVVVTASGDMYYLERKSLFLNRERQRLPGRVMIKPEFRLRGEREHIARGRPSPVEWMFNHFAVWADSAGELEPIATATDRTGAEEKFVDMEISQGKDTAISREIVLGLRGYIQWHEVGDRTDDRADLHIDLPTVHMEARIIVDLDLYPPDDPASRTADLGCELRNSDLAKYQGYHIDSEGNPLLMRTVRWQGLGQLRREDEAVVKEVRREFSVLQERLKKLATTSCVMGDGRPLIDDEDYRSRMMKLKLPKRFLCGRLTWRRPYQGVVLSLTWNKPRK